MSFPKIHNFNQVCSQIPIEISEKSKIITYISTYFQMEFESLESSFDYGLEEENFYEPIKKRRVTFNPKIYTKVSFNTKKFSNPAL